MFAVAGGILIAFAVIAVLVLLVPAVSLIRRALKINTVSETHDEWLARQEQASKRG
jgi:hypothetical protein